MCARPTRFGLWLPRLQLGERSAQPAHANDRRASPTESYIVCEESQTPTQQENRAQWSQHVSVHRAEALSAPVDFEEARRERQCFDGEAGRANRRAVANVEAGPNPASAHKHATNACAHNRGDVSGVRRARGGRGGRGGRGQVASKFDRN